MQDQGSVCRVEGSTRPSAEQNTALCSSGLSGGWIINTSWERWLGDVVLLVGLNCESVMHGKPNQHSAMHKQKTDLKEGVIWSVFYAFVIHILSIYFLSNFCLSLTEFY